MQKRASLLLLIMLCTAAIAGAQHSNRPRPRRPPDPFHRNVRIRQKFQHKGYANVLTANVPHLLITAGCVCISGGAEYERFLTKDGFLSLSLPVYVFTGSTFFFSGAGTGDIITNLGGVYAAPGLMIHPMGNARRIDFSVGGAVMLGSLHRTDREVGITITHPEKSFDRTDNLTGLLAQFNLSIHASNGFVFAPYLAMGAILDAGPSEGAVVQIGVKFGGRF